MTNDHLAADRPPVTRVKSSASTLSDYAYPRGHLGHLTLPEEEAFQKFKSVLEERGLYKRGPPASHDDPLLLRYLRARRWNVEDAFTQFKDTEDWRKANNIDTLYRTIDLDCYERSRRMYPQWTGRRDRRGIPLYVYEIKHLDSKSVHEYEKHAAKTPFSQAETDKKTPNTLLRLFALYENLTRFNMPLSTQLPDREFPETPITLSTNIVDISGVGLKQFWNLKSHMQIASQLATAHYPETLDRIFIIGAPMFFSTVWGWIKRWFDPITVSKIFVLSTHEAKSVLESFIDPANIPKKYGGQLDYNFGDLGVPDPGWEGLIEWENGYTAFPSGPMVWEDNEDGTRLVCVGLGMKDGQLRNERIATVKKTFHHLTLEAAQAFVNGDVTQEVDPATAEPVTAENSVKTEDTLLSEGVQEKMRINDGEVKEAGVVPPAAQPAPVV